MSLKYKKLLMVISLSAMLCVIVVGIYITQGFASNHKDLPMDSVEASEVVNYHNGIKPDKMLNNPLYDKTNEFINMYRDETNITRGHVLTGKEQLSANYIYIPYSQSMHHVVITDLYRSKGIRLNIISSVEDNYSLENIERVRGGKIYTSIMKNNQQNELGYEVYTTKANEDTMDIISSTMNEISWNIERNVTTDPVKQIAYKKVYEMEEVNHEFIFQMDQVYAPNIYVNETGIYISLLAPADAYDNVIVIDAGHGGKDSGAISIGETVFEKDLNLSIVKYMKELLTKEDITVYYTRLSDETIYLQPRVSFANEINADLFLSIHYNASEYESASGSEVLFNERDFSIFSSEEFASFCLDEVSDVTKNINRGLVEGYEMLIIRSAKMPSALVEVGFVTNQKELNFLRNEKNQKDIAEGLVNAIRSSFLEIENRNVVEVDMK